MELGFDPANVSTVTVELPASYRSVPRQLDYVRRTIDALRAMPEIESATAAAMWGVPFSPGQEPIGKQLYYPDDVEHPEKTSASTKYFTVIGVVNAVRLGPPGVAATPFLANHSNDPAGVVFTAYTQRPDTTIAFLARARTPADLTGRIREVMTRTDPQVPMYRPRSMRDWVDLGFLDRRAPMLIAMLFAAAALVLSAVGVYGVMAYTISERRREIGIRLALGETTRGIFLRVFTTALVIIGLGLSAGLAGASVVGGLLKSRLFGVGPTSPLVLGGAALLLTGLVLAASLAPAWRASRINPVEVLER